jgi:hypothetical protein
LWRGGGKKLWVLHKQAGFTGDLRYAAASYATREEAWKVCAGREVPEREEVVVRYLTQQEITG